MGYGILNRNNAPRLPQLARWLWLSQLFFQTAACFLLPAPQSAGGKINSANGNTYRARLLILSRRKVDRRAAVRSRSKVFAAKPAGDACLDSPVADALAACEKAPRLGQSAPERIIARMGAEARRNPDSWSFRHGQRVAGSGRAARRTHRPRRGHAGRHQRQRRYFRRLGAQPDGPGRRHRGGRTRARAGRRRSPSRR